jgi:hypothetical protein
MNDIRSIAVLAKDLLGQTEVQVMKYSGRGMMGRECLAITGSMKQCQNGIVDVLIASHDATVEAMLANKHSGSTIDDPFVALIRRLLTFSSDSMGRDVVLYWPDLPWMEDEDEQAA